MTQWQYNCAHILWNTLQIQKDKLHMNLTGINQEKTIEILTDYCHLSWDNILSNYLLYWFSQQLIFMRYSRLPYVTQIGTGVTKSQNAIEFST